jgi:hypothetical protein
MPLRYFHLLGLRAHAFAWLALVFALALKPTPGTAQPYFWQIPQAGVSPQGTLTWAPEPYTPPTLIDTRYIDFVGGNNNADGLTQATAWKHHPDDPAAPTNLRNGPRGRTYVFKRGVTYRGEITLASAQDLTFCSLPTWGTGEAVLSGAELFAGSWTQSARTGDIATAPASANIWQATLPTGFRPYLVWRETPSGPVRQKVARHPNWHPTDPRDPHADWWEWSSVTIDTHSSGYKIGHTAQDSDHASTFTPASLLGATFW